MVPLTLAGADVGSGVGSFRTDTVRIQKKKGTQNGVRYAEKTN